MFAVEGGGGPRLIFGKFTIVCEFNEYLKFEFSGWGEGGEVCFVHYYLNDV